MPLLTERRQNVNTEVCSKHERITRKYAVKEWFVRRRNRTVTLVNEIRKKSVTLNLARTRKNFCEKGHRSVKRMTGSLLVREIDK